VRSPESHTYVCSSGFTFLPPSHNTNYFGKTAFLFRAVDALAACAHPNHILMYAHRDSLSCRLPTTRTISKKNTSFLFSKSSSCLPQILWI
jgi:hypothetical protein